MSKVKVKICDVRSPEAAYICAQEGVDFLGLHQIYAPLSEKKIYMFNAIKQAAPNLSMVLVTRETNLDKLLKMCLLFEWDYVQMHFDIEALEVEKFKKRLRNNGSSINIISVIETGNIIKGAQQTISKASDFLLFDSSIQGGTGVLSKGEDLAKISSVFSSIPYFVAGGLTPNNVASVIEKTHPYAVDVQSGVEYSNDCLKHHKDPKLIQAFVKAVKGCRV